MTRRFQWIALIAALIVLDLLFVAIVVAIDGHFGFPLTTDAIGTIERHLLP